MAHSKPLTLAAAARMLSRRLQARLARVAELIGPQRARLEAELERDLRRRGYDAKQRKALSAVTCLAAARLLAERRPLAAFFEQVDYHGGRLAKLDLAPAAILGELARAGRQVDASLERAEPEEASELRWARRQLDFATLLTLNHAFYRVREAEAAALHALFQAELAARSHQELIGRCLEILAGYSRADAGWLWLRAPDCQEWVQAGVWPGPNRERKLRLDARLERRLARPRHLDGHRVVEGLRAEAAGLAGLASCWSVPLRRNGRLEGLLQLGFRKRYEWLPRELRLLGAAGERILEASEKARLHEELARREGEIRRLAEHMVHVEELERRRISRELHDEAGQSLLCLRLQLEMLEQRAEAWPALRAPLGEGRRLLERTIEELRRLVADLSPAVLEQLGLAAALRRLVSRFRRLNRIEVRLRMDLGRGIPKRLERVVYRIVQECLNNAGRHSSAAHLNLLLRADDKWLRLRVEDDGVGFEVPKALAQTEGFGLAGIQERVALLGGRIQIESAPGQGARIGIELPIPEGSRAGGWAGGAPGESGRSAAPARGRRGEKSNA